MRSFARGAFQVSLSLAFFAPALGWAAFSLPPRVVESRWALKDAVTLPQVPAQSVTLVSREPVWHGDMRWADVNRTRFRFWARDGSVAYLVSPLSGKPGLDTQGVPAAELDAALRPHARQKTRLGALEWTPTALRYKPDPAGPEIWSIPLDFESTGMERSIDGRGLVGWGIYPARLLVLESDLATLHRIHWFEDSEPVRFFSCEPHKNVLLENIGRGLVRFVFFREAKPVSYSVVKLSEDTKLNEAADVVMRSCGEFYVGGPFGIASVRFNRW